MKQKQKFYQKSPNRKRMLSLVLTFALVLTMGVFPKTAVTAEGLPTAGEAAQTTSENDTNLSTKQRQMLPLKPEPAFLAKK